MNDLHIWSTIAVITLVTAGLRFLPFLIFNNHRKTPKLVDKLGKVLPYAIMGMLVIYCLKSVNFANTAGYLPALISCIITGVLYVWKRNTLISIIAGTLCYMFFIQIVF